MRNIYKLAIPVKALLSFAAASATSFVFAQQAPSAVEVVSGLEKLNGVVPAQRRNHILGMCVNGSFVGNKAIQTYSASPLFSGETIPVIGRFSLAGGNPKAPDTAKSPRGMALEFKLPSNTVHHFTMLNIPIFSAATPATFNDATLANMPDPATGKPDPQKQKAFRESHPDAAPLAAYMAKNNPPASYASSDFYSIHTFKFINKQNQTTLVKWRFVPETGVVRLTDAEMTTMPARFLDEDLMKRLEKGPVKWDMEVTLGEPGDEQLNPTVYWPDARKKVQAGVLTITKATPQSGADCEKINFDPLVMASGIAPTADPVLNFRSSAYAISFGKRLSGN